MIKNIIGIIFILRLKEVVKENNNLRAENRELKEYLDYMGHADKFEQWRENE